MAVVISLCIPVMNRLKYLKQTLPGIVDRAEEDGSCEITLLDYSSTDGMRDYVVSNFDWGTFNYCRIEGQKYYNSALARNICVMVSNGDYIIQLSADTILSGEFLPYIRKTIYDKDPDWMIEDSHTKWIYGNYVGRFLVIKRKEFIAAGGYDERFTCYAPEDKEICHRLHRRGLKCEVFPGHLATEITTPHREKLLNYDKSNLDMSEGMQRGMKKKMYEIYNEDMDNKILVANPDGMGHLMGA